MSRVTRIRRATTGDAAAIASVHVTSWQETYVGLLPDDVLAAQDVAVRARFWSDVIERGPGGSSGSVLVADDTGGPVVGFASSCPQRDADLAAKGFDAELAAIYVLRSAQRQGTGRALLQSVFSAVRANGGTAISLWVLEGNAPARAFYERMDGVLVGTKAGSLGPVLIREVAYGWQLAEMQA